MSLQVLLEFDGTDGAAVTANTTDGGNSGMGNKTGSWLYETTGPATGTAFARVALTGGTAAFTYFHPAARSIAGYDSIQRLSSFDGGGKIIGQVLDGSANCAQVFINSAGKLQLRDAILARATSDIDLVEAQWLRWAWLLSGSQMTAKLWVAPTLVGLFTTPTEVLGPVAYGQGPFDRVKLGAMSGITATFDQDRFMYDDVQFPSTGSSTNTKPIADAGPDQSVTSGDVFTLDGSDSDDPDGTIIAWAWVPVGGVSVPLTDPDTDSPTGTAPTVSSETDMTYQLSVMDNDGAQSLPDNVVITVEPASGTPTDDRFELHEGMSTGDTVTTSNTDYDAVDSGITATGIGIGEGVHSITGTATAIKCVTMILASAVSDGYIDHVYMVDSLPSAGNFITIGHVRSGSTARATVRLMDDGTIAIVGTTTATIQAARTSHAITPGVPFRFAWRPHNGAHQFGRLFLGAGLVAQSVPIEQIESAANLATGTWDRARAGFVLAPPESHTFTLDTYRINLTDWPDPLLSGTVDHSNLFIMGDDGIADEANVTLIV